MHDAFMKAFGREDLIQSAGAGSVTFEHCHTSVDHFFDRDPYDDFEAYEDDDIWLLYSRPEDTGKQYEHLAAGNATGRRMQLAVRAA